ncbi:MAG: hypothetical protein GY909_18310 [Oligoflexia bacterium]|nr:hypothetical protein [Oligoflexia bacterium]
MKILKIVITLLFCLSLFASGPKKGAGGIAGGTDDERTIQDLSWKELREVVRKDFDLSFSHHVVFVGRPMSSLDVCIEGDQFRSMKKYPKYELKRVSRSQDHDGDKDGYTKIQVGEEYLSFPINYKRNERVCRNRNRDSNCFYREVDVQQETMKEIKIIKRERSRNKSLEKVIHSKEFMIPYCE